MSLMVLSQAALPRIAVRGRPVGAETRHVEAQATSREHRESWGRVIHLGKVVHLAVVADRLDIAEHAAGEIVSIGQRRLRQLGDGDAA